MKKPAFAIALSALASLTFAAEPETAPSSTPAEQAARNRGLYEKYKDSVVVVRYYLKKNAKGEDPDLSVPYKCPNCGGTHFHDSGASADKGIPAEFSGFVLSPDRVLMKDVMLAPEFVDRIEVECAGETVPASEFEAAPDREALILRTEKPLSAAKPIAFENGRTPANPTYFFIVREDGETVAGFAASDIANFKHYVERGRDIYNGNPSTLVLDDDGAAVTVALKDTLEIGEETFTPPQAWKTEPAADRFGRLAAAEARVCRAVLPVYLQFEAKGKESGGRFTIRWSSSDDEVKNDVDAVGLVVEGGKVLVPVKLAAADTARLVKIEATLPDGTKVPLEFSGSYVDEGGFEARFKDGVPAGLEPFVFDRRDAVRLLGEKCTGIAVANRGGKVETRSGVCEAKGMKRDAGNVSRAKFERMSGLRVAGSDDGWRSLVLSAGGELVEMEFAKRHDGRWSDDGEMQGRALVALAESPKFDPENVPRKAEDRKRTPWLGVEVQAAGADIVREKKATAYLKRYVDRAPLVTEVAPGSPAEKLGIKVGDILVSAKYPGSSREETLSCDRDSYSEINWEEAFVDDRFIEFGSMGDITPWPDAEGGVNGTLAQFGVGTEVVVAWVSDGVRKEGKVALALAPVHFRNAPRSRHKDLGMTVCDMTYEVRKYFKFDDAAPGVVVAKVKSGGVAAVSGIRPLELIIDVNGEGVKSAKDFVEKTKGKKDLSFTVRRLTNTRIVPIKM